MLKSYLKELFKVAKQGDAREETFYSSLEGLLNNYSESTGKKKIHITTLPIKTEAGNPDFRVWDGKQHIVGYIEAKAPTTEYLDQIETTDQLKRYRYTFPNLILTNFFEFRLYRNGTLIDSVRIGRPFVMHKLKAIPPVEKEEDFLNLLEKFFSFSLPRVYNAKNLAIELAKRTGFLRDEVISEELKEEESQGKGFILGFYEAFRKYLISGLTKEDFADLYSQTITYGLFAARTRSENEFNRKLAYDNIPHTIGILREVFEFISLGDLPKQMEWIVDDIAEVLSVTDVRNILHKYFHEGKGKDPVIHFYETFIAEYDPKTREKRGVYYTPEPVVSYIVRSLDNILKKHFNRQDGFASDSVTVLDPAAGTLTFLAEAAKLAVKEFVSKYGEGGKENFIKEHILKNFYAFELMMAPYAIGHLKMSFLLDELGYKLQENDRFKLYLTNSLEMEELAQTELPGMSSLSEESHLAGRIKKETPILVILGNPPYSGISANMGAWITGLIEEYKYVDGKHFREKKHWLHDDYVKFIRFAQWKIERVGEGILGFITNHSYLDNPTFRGMRQSLMESYNEIYILNLHGSSLKKEKCLDGSKDENVFDIMSGVAITLFIKRKTDKKICQIFYSEIWGLRNRKYNWLSEKYIKTTKWQKLNPKHPYYFFVPQEEAGKETYDKYLKVTDIFSLNSTGVQTSRDHFAIDFNLSTLKRKIDMFVNLKLPDDLIKKSFKLKDMSFWQVAEVRKKLSHEENIDSCFMKIAYRPFDIRYVFYHDLIIHRLKRKVMHHMLKENLGLLLPRQLALKEFHHVFCTQDIVEMCVVSSKTREQNHLFPLYLYSEGLFAGEARLEKKQPNININLIKDLSKIYKKDPTPEEIFYYIYAVLHSNTYRKKYAEFLKIDFPRIPFTKNYKLFINVGTYGKRLVDLHLLKSAELEPPVAKYQGRGDDKVGKIRYGKECIYINKNQYYSGISKEVYQYQIGGYQVCIKWLKDRKGRRLSLDDIKHYCNIVTALTKTIEIQKEIDKIYTNVEKKTVEFENS